ncbi:hypothetical protein DNTS_005212 [Danionella cerebrum]|uniref:C-type lectin domain-containing protein n=1 Tax=Danionella cerebrum TaxID=2873325 RepID=A0A553RH68_9TELE|nr:hypothetical protein DNTS_005212 [Danionella translucida]
MDMTWEDALMFCREHYIDLASAAQTYQLQLLQKSLQNSTTASVWTDLRFLAGEWQWVSRTFREIPYIGSLESCPPDPYRCGAYNISTAQMENRNCEEMLNFKVRFAFACEMLLVMSLHSTHYTQDLRNIRVVSPDSSLNNGGIHHSSDCSLWTRNNFEDLSTITSQQEENVLFTLNQDGVLKWIGLHIDLAGSGRWLWPNGEQVSFSDWAPNQPDNQSGQQYCVAIIYHWFDFDCNVARPFFCSKTRYILVKENKTWEEALQHCKTHFNDLARMNTDRQLQLAKEAAIESQTDSVWTGQRYLVGQWMWTNNDPVQSEISLPVCPAEPYRCGARNIKTDTWENKDCTKMFNFLCN